MAFNRQTDIGRIMRFCLLTRTVKNMNPRQIQSMTPFQFEAWVEAWNERKIERFNQMMRETK